KGTGAQTGCLLIACDSDEDCQDESACNGAEVCDPSTNSCQSGTPVDCSDGVPCSVDGCEEGADGPVCVSLPPDRDRDGFLDAECQPAQGKPGDDCNDEDADISP